MSASKSHTASSFFELSFLFYLLGSSAVYGCGLMPFGQERILRFTVNGFTLALPMVYTEHPASRAFYPGVPGDASGVLGFIRNLVMRGVDDVLEQQGRSAGLPHAVISAILEQLTLNITYEPLKCDSVSNVAIPAQNNLLMMDKDNCLVVSNTVTSICTKMPVAQCMMTIEDVPQRHRTIIGTLRITNIIMANWSNQMWSIILNRVLRSLSSGSFGTNFSAASVTIA